LGSDKLKGVIEIEFETKENAESAKRILKIEEKSAKKCSIAITQNKNKLIFEVSSEEISPFHATISSIIRNLKVIKNIIK
jgi:tRNA threonylcarbamoyladenosine modification (KEOPS) complex  Pcc1 subunit